MKLAILSDTHGLLRPEVTEHLKTADAILHGGDINRQSIVDELRQYAPLYIVRGNNDKDWAEAIPHDLTVTLGGVTFFMVHNRKEVPADLAGVDAVVFGQVRAGRERRCPLAQPGLLRPSAVPSGDHHDDGGGGGWEDPGGEGHHPPRDGVRTAGRLLPTGGSAVCGGGAAHPGRGRGQGIDNRLTQAVLL